MKPSMLLKFLFFSLFIFISQITHAYVGLCCGKCGGNMPLNLMGGGVPETHEFRIKINTTAMHMEDLVDGDSSINGDAILDQNMGGMGGMGGIGMMAQTTGKFMAIPTEMDMNMLNVSAAYSFSDDFVAGIMLMYMDNSMDMIFSQQMAGKDGFTMESDGIGDTMLMAKYRLFTDDPLIPKSQGSLFMGLSLPTGSIDETNSNHPVAMRSEELLPYGMQLGSGTVDPSVGFLYSGSQSPYWWGANAVYTARLYDNDRDYRLGDKFNLDLYSMYQLNHSLVAELQLNSSYQDEINGEMDESKTGESGHATMGDGNSPFTTPLWDPDNYGGTKVGTTLGLQWQPVPLQIFNLQVGIPLYQKLNGIQLEDDWRVSLTWYVELPTKKSRRYQQKGKSNSTLGF